MKKFSIKAVPTATLILFIVAIILAVWAGYQKGLSEGGEFIDTAVIVEDGMEDSTNNGKYVCVPGKLSVVNAPTDPLTGISANGIAVIREVEMYQYYIENDTVYKSFSSVQEKNIKGDGGEKYKNPVFPSDYSNAVFLGDVVVEGGNLIVDYPYLHELTLKNNQTQRDIGKVNIDLSKYANSLPGFTLHNGYFYSGDPSNLKVGDLRIKYTYIPTDNVGEITLFGKQKDSVISAEEDSISLLAGKATDLAGLKEIFYEGYSSTAKGMNVLAVGCFAAGVIVFIIKYKKNKEQEGAEV